MVLGERKIEFEILKSFLSSFVEPFRKNTRWDFQKSEKAIMFQPTPGESATLIVYSLDYWVLLELITYINRILSGHSFIAFTYY